MATTINSSTTSQVAKRRTLRLIVLWFLCCFGIGTGNRDCCFAAYALTTAAKYERKEKLIPRKARYEWTPLHPRVRNLILNRLILSAHWRIVCGLEFSRRDKDTYQVHRAESSNKETNDDEIFTVTVDLPVPS